MLSPFETIASLVQRLNPEMIAARGARLQNCGQGAWMADRVVRLAGSVLLPVRMMLLENESGSLTCYSPVELDSATLEAVAGLGSVQQLVVANRFHMSFVAEAVECFPTAELYVPPTSPGITGIVPNAVVSQLGCNTDMFVMR